MTTLQKRLDEMYHAEDDEDNRLTLRMAQQKLQCDAMIIDCLETMEDNIHEAMEIRDDIDEEMEEAI
jgi:hypothetical protein